MLTKLSGQIRTDRFNVDHIGLVIVTVDHFFFNLRVDPKKRVIERQKLEILAHH
jgi:hypothetical protein